MNDITGDDQLNTNYHRMVIAPSFNFGKQFSLYGEMDIDHSIGKYEYDGNAGLTQLYLVFN